MTQWIHKISYLTLAAGLIGCTAAVQPDPDTRLQPLEPTPTEAAPWTSLSANDDPDDFHFVVVSDRTGEHRAGVFRDANGRELAGSSSHARGSCGV